MRGPVIATLVTSATCLGGFRRAPSPTEISPPASVALAADTASYRVVGRRLVRQVVQGQALAHQITVGASIRTTLAPADQGLAARLTLDSADVRGPGLTPESAPGTGRVVLTAAVGPDGAVATTVPDRRPSAVLDHVGETLRGFWPRLPAGGTSPGVQWTDTSEFTSRVGDLPLVIVSVNRRTTGDWVQCAGATCLPIVTEETFTVTGNGRQSGNELAIEGTGRRYLRQFLSATGRYLGGTGADTTDFEIRLVATGTVVPVRVSGVDTVEVRR
jgi:hypothetical protein